MVSPDTESSNLLYKNKRLRIKFGLSIVANYHEWEQINCPYNMIHIIWSILGCSCTSHPSPTHEGIIPHLVNSLSIRLFHRLLSIIIFPPFCHHKYFFAKPYGQSQIRNDQRNGRKTRKKDEKQIAIRQQPQWEVRDEKRTC